MATKNNSNKILKEEDIMTTPINYEKLLKEITREGGYADRVDKALNQHRNVVIDLAAEMLIQELESPFNKDHHRVTISLPNSMVQDYTSAHSEEKEDFHTIAERFAIAVQKRFERELNIPIKVGKCITTHGVVNYTLVLL